MSSTICAAVTDLAFGPSTIKTGSYPEITIENIEQIIYITEHDN